MSATAAPAFDHGDVVPILEELAADAKHQLGTLFRHAGLAVMGGAIASLGLRALAGPEHFFIWLPLIAGALYSLIRFFRIQSAFRTNFKERVVRTIITRVYPDVHYEPQGSVTRQEFIASRLFLQSIDDFEGEDLIEGTIGRTRFRFSEVHARERQTRRDARGRTRHEWVTVFRGTFLLADFNKNFHGATFVLPDRAQRLLGAFGQSLQALDSRRGELVKLEDPEFERLFVVYSTDQVEARYILSTSLMQRILDYYRKADRTLHFAFVSSCLFIALSSTANELEPPSIFLVANMRSNPSIRDSILSHIRSCTQYLDLTTGVVRELDLNERIWGK